MKSLFAVITILLSVATFGQKNQKILATGYNSVYSSKNPISDKYSMKIDSVLRIMIYPTGLPTNELKQNCFNFSFEGKEQFNRRNDTLTIHDKQIRFIVIDGVTYEIVRTTEVKKAVVPDTIRGPYSYLVPNGITLTPDYLRSN